jgi:uncharacterized protein (TIGR02569 family)
MILLNPKAPSEDILASFGAITEPQCLTGGQGTTWISGSIILKPEHDAQSAHWIASIFDELPDQTEFRFARPIRAATGEWLKDGWVAWSKLEGVDGVTGSYKEKFLACDAFHKAISSIPFAPFLKAGASPWSVADRFTWQEQYMVFHPKLQPLIDAIQILIEPVSLPEQAIHGDMLGNFMFAEGLPPAVIDFSPSWRPAGFAKGVMIADAIAWEGAGADILGISDEPFLHQLVLRGALRRVAEQQQHLKQSNKTIEEVFPEAEPYGKVVELLKL